MAPRYHLRSSSLRSTTTTKRRRRLDQDNNGDDNTGGVPVEEQEPRKKRASTRTATATSLQNGGTEEQDEGDQDKNEPARKMQRRRGARGQLKEISGNAGRKRLRSEVDGPGENGGEDESGRPMKATRLDLSPVVVLDAEGGDSLPDDASTDEHDEEFDLTADGEGVRRLLFASLVPTPRRSSEQGDPEAALQQETGTPPVTATSPAAEGESVGEQTIEDLQAWLDGGGSESDGTPKGPRAHVSDEASHQWRPSSSNNTNDITATPSVGTTTPRSLQFNIMPAQRDWYFAQRTAHEAAIPDIPHFMRALRHDMHKATSAFAGAIGLPDPFKIALPWRGQLPEELLRLFGILGGGLDTIAGTTEDDGNGEGGYVGGGDGQWRNTKMMLDMLALETQAQYTAMELVEGLLGSAITSWVLAVGPLGGDAWDQALGWAAGTALMDGFDAEAREVVLQDIAIRVLEEQLEEEQRLKRASRLAREFEGLVAKLLGVRDLDLGPARSGMAVSVEGESFAEPQLQDRIANVVEGSVDEGRLSDAQQKFLDDMTEIFDRVLQLRLEMAKPGNARYRFVFAKHLDEVWRGGEPTGMRVVFGVLPRVVRISWQSMIEPKEEADMAIETVWNGMVYRKEDWRNARRH